MDDKNTTLDSQYDDKLKAELTRRLKREPTADELVNADNDSDLVNEILWQLLVDIHNQTQTLQAAVADVNPEVAKPI